MTGDYSDPPASDELEISTFGRGLGECVLCHVGDGIWIAVDSFHSESGPPIATDYIEQLRGDHRIQAVVISHWDDDHIHGMTSVIEKWNPEQVWLPAVLSDNELVSFAVEHDEAMEGIAPSGLRDFVRVLRATKGRKVRRWGSAGHSIETETSTVIRLLSPTHDLIDEALTVLGINHAPGEREVTSVESNRTSIVLWIERGDAVALLGADLEATESGWTSVVDAHDPAGNRASLVKVPHHGSDDADDPRIWEVMCSRHTFNVTTRYTRLKNPRPRPTDVQRLLDRTGGLHVAGELPERLRLDASAFDLHLDAASETGIRELGQVGAVRLRRRPGASWSFEAFGFVESNVGCSVAS